jgi:hypothetical protein
MTCLYSVMVSLLQIAHIFCNLLAFVSMQRFRFSYTLLCFYTNLLNVHFFWDSSFQNFFNGCLQCFIHKRVRLFVILLMVKKDFVDVKKRFCWWYQYHINLGSVSRRWKITFRFHLFEILKWTWKSKKPWVILFYNRKPLKTTIAFLYQ